MLPPLSDYSRRRAFVRHPIRLPLVVRPRNAMGAFSTHAGDISEGGVSFDTPSPLPISTIVDLELRLHDTRFEVCGTVAWCRPETDEKFRVGLAFADVGQRFRIKLAEQVLRIDELRETLSRERRRPVTQQEAAQIWVEQYARLFADVRGDGEK